MTAEDKAFEAMLSRDYVSRNPSSELHQKLTDYLEWYTANHQRWGDRVDVHKRMEFLDHAVGGSLYLINLLAQELARQNGSRQPARIWLPPAWARA